MDTSSSRRKFLKTSGAIGAAATFGPLLSACGGGPSAAEMRDMSAAQAVAAIRDGSMSAEAYTQALIARAEQLKDLNALITLDTEPVTAAVIAAAPKLRIVAN